MLLLCQRIVGREEDLQQVALDETDLQSFQRCTPSYVKLPQHCIRANKKSPLAREVLNDRLKSCSIGTEDTESVCLSSVICVTESSLSAARAPQYVGVQNGSNGNRDMDSRIEHQPS